MKWNKRLKDLRIDNDMTQEKLGSYLGIDAKTIARYEKGETEPTISTIIQLALLFNVSIDYIVGLKDVEIIEKDTTIEELEKIINNLNEVKKKLSN